MPPLTLEGGRPRRPAQRAAVRAGARDKASYAAGGPLRDIAAGDNWFYAGTKGYDNAMGVGTLDVAAFAARLASTARTAR